MKHKLICVELIMVLGLLVGCSIQGNQENVQQTQIKENQPSVSISNTENSNEPTGKEIENIIQPTGTETEKNKNKDKNKTEKSTPTTYEDLSKYYYSFTGGAGGLSEFLYIEKDGTFHGTYNFYDAGDTREDYPKGTTYVSNYTGKFTDLKKINEFCYEMKIDHVSYRKEVGTEEKLDESRNSYTEWNCLKGANTCKIYLQGFDTKELSKDTVSWISNSINEQGMLIAPILVNNEKEQALEGSQRMNSYADATAKLNEIQANYDYYGELLSDAQTTGDMALYALRRFDIVDEGLNYIWYLVKYNVDENQYQTILEEQRSWNKEKEKKGKGAYEEWNGYMAACEYHEIRSEETMKRCATLVTYLE